MLHVKNYILLATIFFISKGFANVVENVFLCYGKIAVDEIKDYKYVILEEAYYTKEEVLKIKENNQKVLCYISLGELDKYVSYYEEAKNYVLPGKNAIWNSYFLDLSKEGLQNILLQNIEKKLAKGFDGLFLDNIDNYGTWGKQKQLKKHLYIFLAKIVTNFPNAYLMQNAGLDLVNTTHDFIDSIAIESVITNYDFSKKKYRLREEKDSKKLIESIKKIEEEYQIPFLLIEYTNDLKMYQKIQKRLKKYKWSLFVGQIDLQQKPIFN